MIQTVRKHIRNPYWLATGMRNLPLVVCWVGLALGLFVSFPLDGEEPNDVKELMQRGEKIYQTQCASCHGSQGEGVRDHYAEPLTGDASLLELTRLIDRTMPEGEPEKCTGPDAEAVARFVYDRFYSEAAQIRNHPPRVGIARLTAPQLRQSLADLYSHFSGLPNSTKKRGVRGVYFNGAQKKNDSKKIDRTDSMIDFDFGFDSPGEGIDPKAFAISWEGGILADVSGRYEIVVRSTCSFVMDFGKIGRELINNHVQSGDKIEFRKSVTLTAGRVYPFKIDFVQRTRKTEQPPARITLAWVPPHGIEEVIGPNHLVPEGATGTFSLESILPPDDRSYGFERGVAINRQWDESTTAAAIEFGNMASTELWSDYRRRQKKDEDENRTMLRSFLTEIAETAFRGPLDDTLKEIYIERQLHSTDDDREAIKRSVLLVLKSPRFLYPWADASQSLSQRRANRLALVLWDSLPSDASFLKTIQANRLGEEKQVRALAEQMVLDRRTQAKLLDLLHEWLNLKQFQEITKDEKQFPGFDPLLVNDLRHSLDLFLKDLIQSESADFRQLFLSDWTFTTERLEKFYGAGWEAKDGEWSRQSNYCRSQPDPKNRFGVLTHPFLLSGLSYHNATSPIHRGVFLIRFLLGRTLRPPKEAFAPLSPDLHPQLTTRERVTLQTSPENCQVCHSKINALGFILENYDAVGKIRYEERSKTIDASGSYADRVGKERSFQGVRDLAHYLAESPDAHRAFVSRVFLHFVKQPLASYGPQTLDELVAKFVENDYNIRKLLVEIAVVASTRDPNLNGSIVVAERVP